MNQDLKDKLLALQFFVFPVPEAPVIMEKAFSEEDSPLIH